MAKKWMEKDGERVKVDVESGSVDTMAELGWKEAGDAEEDPSEVMSKGGGLLPEQFRNTAFLEAALNQLPAEIVDPDETIRNLKANFGDLVTADHEAFVRSRTADGDDGDNTDVDPKYHQMPMKQLKELMDAKGLAYKPNDSKAKLVETLKASNPAT